MRPNPHSSDTTATLVSEKYSTPFTKLPTLCDLHFAQVRLVEVHQREILLYIYPTPSSHEACRPCKTSDRPPGEQVHDFRDRHTQVGKIFVPAGSLGLHHFFDFGGRSSNTITFRRLRC